MGYIGLHLSERVSADGAQVLCVDNCFARPKDNIAQLMSNPHFEQARHDVRYPRDGDGEQTSSFGYVEARVDAHQHLMANVDNFAAPVNSGTSMEVPILAQVHEAIVLTGAKSETVFKSLPIDDPRPCQPDDSCAWQMLIGDPVVAFSLGLGTHIEYPSRALASQITTPAVFSTGTVQ